MAGLILYIIGKIIEVLLILGVIGWIVAFARAAFGISRGESFLFFLPFCFISSRHRKR
ncbi:MAG: hypothetical protein NC111_07435 [Bacteroides sp.]|nr:hypothetical protein [Bacteroides sp.]